MRLTHAAAAVLLLLGCETTPESPDPAPKPAPAQAKAADPEPAKPVAPVAPAEPVAPVAPAKPVAPVAPAEPVAPVPPAQAARPSRPQGAEWPHTDHPAPIGPASPEGLKYDALVYNPPKRSEHRHELPGGIPCYLVEDHLLPVVNITLRWKGGTTSDPAGKSGAVALLGTLMRTGGTANRTAAQVDSELERIAASVSFSFDEGSGTASLRVLRRHLDAGLDLFFEMLREPGFAESRLQLARTQTLEQMKARNDSTTNIQRREIRWLLYGTDHPRAKVATQAEFESITADDLRALHQALIHPSRMMALVAGDWTVAEATRVLGERLSGWGEAPAEPAGVPTPVPSAKPGLYLYRKTGVTQSRVLLARLGITADHPDRHAIYVMNYVLGGGSFSSRLTQAIRVDRGLAYSAGSSFEPGTWHAGAFVAAFQSKHATCAEGLRVALAEMARLKKDGPTADEVAKAKAAAIEAFPRQFATAEAVAAALGGLEFMGRPQDTFETFRAGVEQVTMDDVVRVAREWLDPGSFYITMVGDIDAIKAGAGDQGFGVDWKPVEIPLPDPFTLKRPE